MQLVDKISNNASHLEIFSYTFEFNQTLAISTKLLYAKVFLHMLLSINHSSMPNETSKH